MLIRYQSLDGSDTKYRVVPDNRLADHSTLCQAFNLDPIRARIDAPAHRTGHRVWEAVVLFSGSPIGRLFECREGDRYRDLDPTTDAWAKQTR